jgi:hypothetical protein
MGRGKRRWGKERGGVQEESLRICHDPKTNINISDFWISK